MACATAQVGTLLVALSAGLAAPGAAAPAPPALRVDVAGCPDEIAANLPALASLEIDVLLRERGPTLGRPDSVSVRCTESAAHIEVTLAGARRASTMQLGALATDHRARAIALATAELVHALSSPTATVSAANPPASAAAAGPGPASETLPDTAALRANANAIADRNAAGSSSPQWAGRPAVLVGALAEWLGKPRTTLLGARVAFQHPVGAVLVPALSVDGSFGDAASDSGRVAVRTFGAAAHLYARAAIGRVRFDAGPGARIAWLSLRGEPPTPAVEGRALSAVWGGPEVRARVAYGPLRAPLVALELGAGLVARPVHGLVDGTAAAFSLDGSWVSACLQAGIEW